MITDSDKFRLLADLAKVPDYSSLPLAKVLEVCESCNWEWVAVSNDLFSLIMD